MVRGKRDGLLIAGGGLAGSLAAVAMAKLRPEVPILLVQDAQTFGGDRSWSFFDREIDEADRWLVEPLIENSWEGYYVAFPEHSRKLKGGFNRIRSQRIDALVRDTLRPDQYRRGAKVVAVRENELVLQGGEKIRADGAIDARGPANLSMLDLGWQKFVAREYRLSAPHKVDRPVMIDATVEQEEGFRFVHCLPLSETRLLVRDCYYSKTPDLDVAEIGRRIDRYVARRRWQPAEIEREESGALPVTRGGDFGAFWRVGGARVAKLGQRGGFFHPTTGHTVPDAVRTAIMLSQQRDYGGALLHDLFEAHAGILWKKRDFYRSFNAALLNAAPADRVAAFQELYRLDPAIIGRFHSGQLGMLDKLRVTPAAKAAARQKAR